MAYDERIAERVRRLIKDQPSVTERKMFGGLAFLVGGHMAVAANRAGGLMIRVDPEDAEDLITRTAGRVVRMRGREMRGWLEFDAEQIRTRQQLAKLVALGTAFTSSLPPKP